MTHILLFVLPFFVFVIVLECLIRQVPNSYKYKYDWMQTNAESVETLVLGSSHSFYGIRPEFLDGNAFSLANVSQTWKQDLFLLDYWADKYRNLKTIICPVSYFSFTGRGMEFGSESYRCRYYRIYMDCNLYNSLKYRFELADYQMAMAKVNLNMFCSKGDNGFDKYGWGSVYQLSKKDMINWDNGSEAAAAVKRHTATSYEYVEKNSNYLKEIANFCRKRGIKLFLVTTPCWGSYTDNLNKEQLSKMYESLKVIQREFDFQYFDYLTDNRFVADDFFDSNHLSHIGAEKFTKILNEKIKEIK